MRFLPEFGLRTLSQSKIRLVECFNSPNVFPITIVKVGLYMEAHVLGARNNLAAEIIGLIHFANQLVSCVSLQGDGQQTDLPALTQNTFLTAATKEAEPCSNVWLRAAIVANIC